MNRLTLYSVFTGLSLLFFGYSPVIAQEQGTLAFEVKEAPEWTQLFNRDSGWLGGDGLFSIPMNGIDTIGGLKESPALLVFSDSFWGEKANGKIRSGGDMVNNSVALIPPSTVGAVKKEKLRFYHGSSSKEKLRAVFIPNTPSSVEGQYYWLGDGFLNQEMQQTLYLFAYRMNNTGAAIFGFKECGNALLAISREDEPPYKHYRQLETPLFVDSTKAGEAYSFGAGIFVNTEWAKAPHPDGYVYIYGVKGQAKELLVARVKPKAIEDFEQWRFWNGKTWNSDILQAAPATSNVSNELSLTPLPNGRYALIFQKNGIEPTIGLRIGESPTGPFGSIIPLYTCPEPARKKTLFAYNAKAHPTLSKAGELLISYHVNSFDFLKDFSEEPDTFAPKFIRIIFK